jgi:hypothetical protein
MQVGAISPRKAATGKKPIENPPTRRAEYAAATFPGVREKTLPLGMSLGNRGNSRRVSLVFRRRLTQLRDSFRNVATIH